MQPEPLSASHNITHQQIVFASETNSQHGQRCSDDLQDSLQPHPGELWGEPPVGGPAGYATRPDDANNRVQIGEPDGLKAMASPSPPPRDRITEYENALASSPRKHADGPLFEVIKGSTKPGDKSSPIAKLPNGAYISLQTTMNTNPSQGPILTLRRGLDTRYCPPFAERSRRCVPCLSPLPWCSYYPTRVAGGFRSLLPWPTLPRRRGIPLSAGRQW